MYVQKFIESINEAHNQNGSTDRASITTSNYYMIKNKIIITISIMTIIIKTIIVKKIKYNNDNEKM